MLKDLSIMLPDAKYELDKMKTLKDEEYFLESIFVPDNINLEEMLSGNMYFLCGDKGSGKTAMLIYLALLAERRQKALRAFIIFKEYSREERDDFKKLSYITQYDQSEFITDYDYECVWRWIFHKCIANTIEQYPDVIFKSDDHLNEYLNTVNAVILNMGNRQSKLPFIIKDGYVELKADFAPISANMKLNFERNPNRNKEVRFSTIVNELDNLYRSLTPTKKSSPPLFIIVDELNLSYMNTTDYQRDMLLIRDLIVSIEYFNRITKLSHGKIIILGGIRSEVQNAIALKGKEINKILESFGQIIDWTGYYSDPMAHPLIKILIKILIKYLRISEKKLGIEIGGSDTDIYKRWVSPQMRYKDSAKIILDSTLYRPRHIVRLLNTSKKLCGNLEKIDFQVMSSIRKVYSSECWQEAVEELSVDYNKTQLERIENLLVGCVSITDKNALLSRATNIWPKDENSNTLLNEFDKLTIALYRIGVIGNIYIPGGNQRWYFRRDYNFLTEIPIVINQTFHQQLAIKNIKMSDYETELKQ